MVYCISFSYRQRQSVLFSQTVQTSIQNLSEKADIIVTGKVTDQKSEWNSSKDRILTKVTILVDEFLKGSDSHNQIVVTHPGGEVGEVGELYSHMPKFNNSEEVLLFLKKDKQNNFKVLDGEDGKLTLYHDQVTGEKITSFNEKISSLKNEIKKYIGQQ